MSGTNRKKKSRNRRRQLRQEQKGFISRDGDIRELLKKTLKGAADRGTQRVKGQMGDLCRQYCTTLSDPEEGGLSKVILDSSHLGNLKEAKVIHFHQTVQVTAVTDGGSDYIAQLAMGLKEGPYADRNIAITNNGVAQTSPNFPSVGAPVSTAGKQMNPVRFLQSAWTAAGANAADFQYTPLAASIKVLPSTHALERNGMWVCGSSPDTSATDASSRTWDQLSALPYAKLVPGTDAFVQNWISPEADDYYKTSAQTANNPSEFNLFAMWKGGQLGTSVPQTWTVRFDAIYYAWGRRVGGGVEIVRVPNLLACVRDAYSSPQTEQTVSSRGDIDAAQARANKTFMQTARRKMGELIEIGASAAEFAGRHIGTLQALAGLL